MQCISDRIKWIIGITGKIRIDWEYPAEPDLTLDDIDFYLQFRAKNIVRIDKNELYREESSEGVKFYAYLNSTEVGCGNVILRLYAEIPDVHAPDGVRIDISEIDTNITVYD